MISKPDILSAKILIVDDQETNVLMVERILLDEGYTCIASTMDPNEVSTLYRQNNYDLILLDLEMPGMDGFQVLEGLKKIESYDYLPVLVITGQPGHKLRALQAGAKDFVSKPFDLVEVQTRIHNMLEVRLLYKKLENYNKKLEQTVAERTAELRESEARFRHLTELASDWYWEQDENGHFTKVYGPVLEMLGITVDRPVLEMLGITVDTLLGEPKGNDGAGWNEAEHATFKANIAARLPFIDFVYSRTKSDGSRQYLMVSGEPMFASSGLFTGYRGIGRDVTKSMHSAQGSDNNS